MGVGTGGDYISRQWPVASRQASGETVNCSVMLLNPFSRRDDGHPLAVGMTGVSMGDRLLQIGCAHGGRLGAIAGKVGLSGRAVAIVPDEVSAARARKGAEQAGVLVEVEVAPPMHLPVDDAGFDVAIVDDTGGFAGSMPAENRKAMVDEIFRALRPGGRVILIGATPGGGVSALLRPSSGPLFVASGDANAALTAGSFKPVRTLAAREGLVFVEGIKPRQ